MIFLIGFMITLFVSIELGVYAMIALSLLVLLFRSFQTHGSFLGYSSLRTVETSKSPTPGSGSPVEDEVDSLKLNNHRTGLETERKVFLPLDRHDGSNPKIQLETPEPGIFIYRFKEGFNYTNCSKQLDEMSEYVTFATRRGQPPHFEKPGVSSPFLLL
jgi:sodium-independent sulfate anion transporter 11